MNPKILSIEEAWKLYNLMGDTLKISPDELIVNVASNIAKKVSKKNIFLALDILYGDYKISLPDTIVSMLMSGLQQNRMNQFYSFVNGVSTHASRDVS